MIKLSYINGRFLPHKHASVHIEDRGFLFADGVYEVVLFKNGLGLDFDEHYERLVYSCENLKLAPPKKQVLLTIIKHLLHKNRAENEAAPIYIQITRGVSRRQHEFPNDQNPSLMVMMIPYKDARQKRIDGVSVILRRDKRWQGCHIKSIALLPNILAKQEAKENKAAEVWLMDDSGIVREGSATNAFIIKNGCIITHPLTNNILPGITRQKLLKLALTNGISVEERPFSDKEAMTSDEAFYTSTTQFIIPVVQIENMRIGDGLPGPVTKSLMSLYESYVEELQKEVEFA